MIFSRNCFAEHPENLDKSKKKTCLSLFLYLVETLKESFPVAKKSAKEDKKPLLFSAFFQGPLTQECKF